MNFRRYHEYPIHRDPGAISWVRKNGGESFQELACVAGVERGSGLGTEGTVIGQQKIFWAQSEASIYSATFAILYEAVYVHAGELSSRRVFSENKVYSTSFILSSCITEDKNSTTNLQFPCLRQRRINFHVKYSLRWKETVIGATFFRKFGF